MPSGSAKGDRADALGAGELVKSQDAAVIALDPPWGRERGMSGRRGPFAHVHAEGRPRVPVTWALGRRHSPPVPGSRLLADTPPAPFYLHFQDGSSYYLIAVEYRQVCAETIRPPSRLLPSLLPCFLPSFLSMEPPFLFSVVTRGLRGFTYEIQKENPLFKRIGGTQCIRRASL